MTLKTLSAAGGAGGAVVASLATGWVGAAVLIAAILAPIIALCWIVADQERPQRLAMLVIAWRSGSATTTRGGRVRPHRTPST